MKTRTGAKYSNRPSDTSSLAESDRNSADMDAPRGTSAIGASHAEESSLTFLRGSASPAQAAVSPASVPRSGTNVSVEDEMKRSEATNSLDVAVISSDEQEFVVEVPRSGTNVSVENEMTRSGANDSLDVAIASSDGQCAVVEDNSNKHDAVDDSGLTHRGPTSQKSRKSSYTDVATERATTVVTPHVLSARMVESDGFRAPRSPARTPSRAASPTLSTKAKYFAGWFERAHNPELPSPKSMSDRWSDYEDDDFLGDIPASWTVPTTLPADQPDEGTAFGAVLEECINGLDPKLQEVMRRRTERLKDMRLMSATSISKSSNSAAHRRSLRSRHGRRPSVTLSEAPTAANGGRDSTPRISAAAKGKGKALLSPSDSVIDTARAQSTRIDIDERRAKEQQIEIDAEVAHRLQAELTRQHTKELGESVRAAREDGPSGHRYESADIVTKALKLRAAAAVPVAATAPRASSQLPKGSHLYRATIGHASDDPPPAPSTPSSSSSSSSSSDEESASDDESDWPSIGEEPPAPDDNDDVESRRSKEALRRKWKKEMIQLRMEQANAKPDPPFVYQGEPVFSTYQRWVLEAREWLKFSFVRRENRVARLHKYLSGRAYAFYSRDVARKPSRWTLSRFFTELFDHCFPTNFRTVQREKYLAFRQMGHPVRNYRRDLEDLADSVGRISKRDFVIRFWQGADLYLRIKWAENGYDPEESSIGELEQSADRFEKAAKMRDDEESRWLGDHDYSEDDPSSTSSTSDASEPQEPANYPRREERSVDKRRTLTREQLTEYRATGRCFECGNVGHLSRHCPQRRTAETQLEGTLRASSVDFHELARLEVLRTDDSLGVMMVQPVVNDLVWNDARDDGPISRTLRVLHESVPFVYDYYDDPSNDPMRPERFTMRPRPGHPGEFALWDWHMLDDHFVTLEQLKDPSFNVHTWIHHEKAKIDDTLQCEPVTGYPDFPNPVQRDYNFGLDGPSPQFLTPAEDASLERLRAYVRSDLLRGVPYLFDDIGSELVLDVYSPHRFLVEAYGPDYILVTDGCVQHEYMLPLEEACSLGFCAAFWLEQVYCQLLEVPMDLDRPGDVQTPPRRSQAPMLSSDRENIGARADALACPAPSRAIVDASAELSTQGGRTYAVDVSLLEESVERVDIEEAWQQIPKEELNASGIDDAG